jgi:hypothetical protein
MVIENQGSIKISNIKFQITNNIQFPILNIKKVISQLPTTLSWGYCLIIKDLRFLSQNWIKSNSSIEMTYPK